MAKEFDLELLGKILAELNMMIADGASFDEVIDHLVAEHSAKLNQDGLLKTFSCGNVTGSSRKLSPAALIASWRGAAEKKCGIVRNDEQPEIPGGDARLRLLVERFERLDEEQRGIAQDKADVLAEAKAVGYDRRGFKEVIRLRRLTPDERSEQDMITQVYREALGIA